ncbi:MAG TPA: hypothetical protein VFV71_09780 [Burkholderiales bacterium]|nr:hypothetical protein [Burkholderiales bacterium]
MKSSLRSRVAVACALAALALPCAGEEAMSRAPRSDSLELPGLTAGCHICEWRPKPNQMSAAEECGVDDAGVPRLGLFECGFSQDCQRECHFVRCGTL